VRNFLWSEIFQNNDLEFLLKVYIVDKESAWIRIRARICKPLRRLGIDPQPGRIDYWAS
jgi:hypothetical protein